MHESRQERSGGRLSFHVASLYTTLYRLEQQGLISGRWVEKAGQRRRRFYRLTRAGRERLATHRRSWREFVAAVDGVVLALPYPEPDRITMVWLDNERQGIKEAITSYPNYVDWRDQNSSSAHLATVRTLSFNLTGAGEPERLPGALATASYVDVVGLPPLIGRVFTTENEIEGKDRVGVLSYGLWQRRFGGTPDVIGRTFSLNGQPHEVIGVMIEA